MNRRRASLSRLARLSRGSIVAAAFCLASSGCTGMISRAIGRTPNHGVAVAEVEDPPPEELRAFESRGFLVEVGPPPARLAVRVLEARPPEAGASPRAPATVVVLHGWRKEKWRMARTARRLLLEGRRVVLVDLRGHGRSTGDWMSYGVIEARDLSQVLDALEERGALRGPLGVGPLAAWGISYGAAVALQWAAREPRLQTVVAVCPFSTLRAAVPRCARLALVGLFLREKRLQAALDRAGEDAGFDPDQASPLRAMGETHAPVLLIHGESDWVFPPWHACELQARAPGPCELVLLEGLGHNALFRDPGGAVTRAGAAWLERWLGR